MIGWLIQYKREEFYNFVNICIYIYLIIMESNLKDISNKKELVIND